MRLPGNNKHVDELRETMRRAGVGRVLFWLFVFNLPVAMGLVALPESIALIRREIIALIAFAVSQTLFYFKIRSLGRRER